MLASTTVAAVANIDIGGGSVVNVDARAATPHQVKPGNVAGFYLWVQNDDAANLSTFFMNALSDSDPVGAYWSRNEETTKHGCLTTTMGIECNFGALNSGDELFIVAAYTATSSINHCMTDDPPVNSGGFAPTDEDSYACVDFQFGSESGFVPGKKKGNNSRGDAYHWFDFVATDTNSDQSAQFPFCDLSESPLDCDTDLLTIFNSTGANRNNVQSTQLTAPAGAFNSDHGSTGLAVADNFPFSCADAGSLPACSSHETTGSDGFVGQWSQVDVNTEQDFGDAFIKVTLTMYGVNPNSIDGVVHLWQDDLDVWHEDTITDECATADGPGVDQDECFWVTGSGQNAVVSVWIHNNGRARTF
jgi:hypothetical protein